MKIKCFFGLHNLAFLYRGGFGLWRINPINHNEEFLTKQLYEKYECLDCSAEKIKTMPSMNKNWISNNFLWVAKYDNN